MAECSKPAVGRPNEKPIMWFKGLLYQVASWKMARRVVPKEELHAEKLFLRLGFIVTNAETPSRAVVRFYTKRETAGQWIKEGKQPVKMARLSCHRFRPSQMRLVLSLLAYNLENLARRLALPKRIENCSPTESAATAGEGGRRAGEECPLPLASSDRRASDSMQWQ